jgi:beta-aspartyl-peptidase (threonine type)
MSGKDIIVLTHGGAGSRNEYSDGAKTAAEAGIESIRSGSSVLDGVCRAVTVLEDDTRFNAGMGSHARADGSVEMDASVMDDTGCFGAVTCVEGYRNPVLIARAVSVTEYRILAGRGAAEFANHSGLEKVRREDFSGDAMDFSSEELTTDTVGAVTFDGDHFAAGLSTGGIKGAHPGRVGDVPLIGCGLYAGPKGAVASTGAGEAIIMNMTAIRAYQLIEQGVSAEEVLRQAIAWFPQSEAFGLLVVTRDGYAGGSNRTMAWAWTSVQGQ